jgi:raffinose/stachyose/melibiose transport system substrate-binding protein
MHGTMKNCCHVSNLPFITPQHRTYSLSYFFHRRIIMKDSSIKKVLVLLLSAIMVFTMAACGGGSSSGGSEGGEGGAAEEIKIFNSKSEIQSQFEELGEAYAAETGIPVSVGYSQDTVAAHLGTRYSSNDPYTINMVDAKDFAGSFGEEHGLDLTGMAWVDDTDQEIVVNGKVLGYPVCVEGRGIIYNKNTIDSLLGEDFDPATIKTLDDFKALCQKLVDAGMEAPTGIMKEDWSLAAHYLAQFYEERADVDAYVASLKAGEAKVIEDEKFNALMDTFDVLKEFNVAKAGPVSVERETLEQYLAEGTIAFLFGGNWDFALIKDFDYTGGAGLMPVPQNLQDDYTGKMLGGGSKYFYIDASENTSETQQQEAKDFLTWLTSSEEGMTFVSETCGMVSPYASNTVTCSDDLGASLKTYADANLLIPNYAGFPDDHYAVLGAEMQKYLANQCSRAELATAIEEYWKKQA